MKRMCMGLLLAATAASGVSAQQGSTAITDSLKGPFTMVKGNITRAAEQVPEAQYAYQPTKEVRTFGQLVGHIADANYMFCALASGEKTPAASVEQTMKTKAELQKALAASFDFCDRAFAGLNDQTGAAEATIAAINNLKSTKLGVLALNTAHDMEHYGNMVTYMRMNKMVPPSSQGGN